MAPKAITWDGKDAQGKPFAWDAPGLTWDGTAPERKSKMPHLRVSYGFAGEPDHVVEDVAGGVIDNLYENAAFPTPPVTKVALQAAVTEFSDAINAMEQGGTAATAEKNNKREALIALLRQLGSYVELNCNNDLATLLSSGFHAVSTNRTQQLLEKPIIVTLGNGMTGQLVVKVKAVPNAHSYEVRYGVVTGGTLGPLQSGGIFTDSRAMPVGGLTAGTLYQVQVRAVGGSTGYSDWSDPSQHMSM
ncbi:MAG: fibronectin type III domain-containing protein [Verrucomicrobia bacterium]|nr:fibronectin type III domain-containing protein [Verrucomicrobiota bacterium]